jgi:hypothetical protein
MQYMPRSDSIDEELASVRIWRDKKTGKVVMEEWRDAQGLRHRIAAPAQLFRNPETDVVCTELWAIHGKEHRDDGPAVTNRDAVTGKVTFSCWCRDGVQVARPKRSRQRKQPLHLNPKP